MYKYLWGRASCFPVCVQIAGEVGFSCLFHIKCDIIWALVGPTNCGCMNKISSKLLWLFSSFSNGKILNYDYHYWFVKEHCIFGLLWLLLFFSVCLFVFKSSVFLQRFQLQLLATWGWNSQADIAIDNITFGMNCFADGEPCVLQNPIKNLDSVISIQLIRNTLAVFLPCTKSAHESFMLAFISQCQLS